MARLHNFNAGPGVLPESVLREAQEAIWELPGAGLGILEMSHRGGAFDAVIASARERLSRLLNLSDDQEVLFLQGGARTQFFMLPMSLLRGGRATYLETGVWAEAAAVEARRFGTVDIPFSSKATGYDRVPRPGAWGELPAGTKYLHYTSNNTVAGTEFPYVPEVPEGVWRLCDTSSNLLSQPVDGSRFDVLYGGVQKNLGPAGVTLVVLRRGLLDAMDRDLPTMLRYDVWVREQSLYNTPNVFGIYMVERVCAWIEAQGGLQAIAARNAEKAARVYAAIDGSGGVLRGKVEPWSRSRMNVTFTTGDAATDTRFVAEARDAGLVGLKGHKLLGGLRASLYNALPDSSVDALVDFLHDWARRHG